MKLREKIYSLFIALPSTLFTSVQIMLVLRFICKIIAIDPHFILIELLYSTTDILVFPFIVLLNFLTIPSGGILFEALLLPGVIIYALSYEIIRMIITKITRLEDEEE